MKRTLLPLCLCLVLTGCGAAHKGDQILTPPQEEVQTEVPEETAAPAEESTEEETTESPTEPPTEPETEHPTEPETEAEAPTEAESSRADVIAAYKTALQSKIDEAALDYGLNSVDVTYTLYDMDYDGIPELLVHYGTCEADFRIAIYTYRNNGLKLVSDGLHGGHTSFGYDYVANQIVLCEGHMGFGNMYWYDLDDSGNLRFLIDTDYFEFAGEDTPDYDDYMKQYNVAWLDGSTFFGTDTTWVFSYPDDEYQSEEFGGFDYRYLENYPF